MNKMSHLLFFEGRGTILNSSLKEDVLMTATIRDTFDWFRQKLFKISSYSVSSSADFTLGSSEYTRVVPELIDFLQARQFSKLIGIYRCALIQVLLREVLDESSPRKREFDALCAKYPSYRLQEISLSDLFGFSKMPTDTPALEQGNVVYVPQIPFMPELLKFFSEINFNEVFNETSFELKPEPALVVRFKRIYNFMLKLEKILVLLEENRMGSVLSLSQAQEIFTDFFNLDIDFHSLVMAQMPELKQMLDAFHRLGGLPENDDIMGLLQMWGAKLQKWTSQEQISGVGEKCGFWIGLLLSQSNEKHQSITTLKGIGAEVYQSIDAIKDVCEDWTKSLSETLPSMTTVVEKEITKKLQLSTRNFLKDDKKAANLLTQLFNEGFIEQLRGYQGEIAQHFSDIIPSIHLGNHASDGLGFSSFSNLKKLHRIITVIKLVYNHVYKFKDQLKTLEGSYNDVLLLLLMHLKYDVILSVVSYVDMLQNTLFLESGNQDLGLGLTDSVEIAVQQLYGTTVAAVSNVCDFSENRHLEVLFDDIWLAKRKESAQIRSSHLHGEILALETIKSSFDEFEKSLQSWEPSTDFSSPYNPSIIYELPTKQSDLELLQQRFVLAYPLIQKFYPTFADEMRHALQNSSDLLQLPENLNQVRANIDQSLAHHQLQKETLNRFLNDLTNLNKSKVFFFELPEDTIVSDTILFKMMKSDYAIFKLGANFYFLNKLTHCSHLITSEKYDALIKICRRFFNKPGCLFHLKPQDCQKLLTLFAANLSELLGAAEDFSATEVFPNNVSRLNSPDVASVLRQGSYGQEERLFKTGMKNIIMLIHAIEKRIYKAAAYKVGALDLSKLRQQVTWNVVPEEQKSKLCAELDKLFPEVYCSYISDACFISSLLEFLKSKLVEKLVEGENAEIFEHFDGASCASMLSMINSAKLIKSFKLNNSELSKVEGKYLELSEAELLDVYNAYEAQINQFEYHHSYYVEWFKKLHELSPYYETFKDLSVKDYSDLLFLLAAAEPIFHLAYGQEEVDAIKNAKSQRLADLTRDQQHKEIQIQEFKARLELEKSFLLQAYQAKLKRRAGHPESLAAIVQDQRLGKILRHDKHSKSIASLMTWLRSNLLPLLSSEMQQKLALTSEDKCYPIEHNPNAVYQLPKQVADLMWLYNSLYRLHEFAKAMEDASGTSGWVYLPSQIELIKKYFAFQNLFFFYRPSAQPVFNLTGNYHSRVMNSTWSIVESKRAFEAQLSDLKMRVSLPSKELVKAKTLVEQQSMDNKQLLDSLVHWVCSIPFILKNYKNKRLKSFTDEEISALQEKNLKIAKRVDGVLNPGWYFTLFELPNLAFCVFDSYNLIKDVLSSTKELSYDNFNLIRAEIYKIYAALDALEIDLGVKDGLLLLKAEHFFEPFTQKLLQSMRVSLVDYLRYISKHGAYEYRKQLMQIELGALRRDEGKLDLALRKLQQFTALTKLEDKLARLNDIYQLIEEYQSVRSAPESLSPEFYYSNPKKLQQILLQDEAFKRCYNEGRKTWGKRDDAPVPDNFIFPNDFLNFATLVMDAISGKLDSVRLSITVHQNRIAQLDEKIVNPEQTAILDKTTTSVVIAQYYDDYKKTLLATYLKRFESTELHTQYRNKFLAHFSAEFEQTLKVTAEQDLTAAEDYLTTTMTKHAADFDKKERLAFEKKRLILDRISAFEDYLTALMSIDALTENAASITMKLSVLKILKNNLLKTDCNFDNFVFQVQDSYTALTLMGNDKADTWMRYWTQCFVYFLECFFLVKSHRHSFFYALQDTAKLNLSYEKIKPKLEDSEFSLIQSQSLGT